MARAADVGAGALVLTALSHRLPKFRTSSPAGYETGIGRALSGQKQVAGYLFAFRSDIRSALPDRCVLRVISKLGRGGVEPAMMLMRPGPLFITPYNAAGDGHDSPSGAGLVPCAAAR
jgi:hypothetical protein